MKKYYGRYTPEAAKSLKGYDKLICRTAEDGTIYLCNGYLIFAMSAAEYDTVARPVTQCDAGNWALDKNGKRPETKYDLEKHFTEAVKAVKDAAPLHRSHLLSDVGKNQFAVCYYNPDKDFSALFNRFFVDALSGDTVLKSAGSVSAAVAYSGDTPFAMILPIKPQLQTTRAVKAYFSEQDQAEELKAHLSSCNDELKLAQDEIAALTEQNAQQASEIAALREQIVQLEAQQSEAAEDAKPEPQTAAQIIADRWSQVDGLTASVKGAQTAAPVVWLEGNTKKHAKAIEAEGGKWSHKRNAYYFRVA
jgi:hypothetical protein